MTAARGEWSARHFILLQLRPRSHSMGHFPRLPNPFWWQPIQSSSHPHPSTLEHSIKRRRAKNSSRLKDNYCQGTLTTLVGVLKHHWLACGHGSSQWYFQIELDRMILEEAILWRKEQMHSWVLVDRRDPFGSRVAAATDLASSFFWIWARVNPIQCSTISNLNVRTCSSLALDWFVYVHETLETCAQFHYHYQSKSQSLNEC